MCYLITLAHKDGCWQSLRFSTDFQWLTWIAHLTRIPILIILSLIIKFYYPNEKIILVLNYHHAVIWPSKYSSAWEKCYLWRGLGMLVGSSSWWELTQDWAVLFLHLICHDSSPGGLSQHAITYAQSWLLKKFPPTAFPPGIGCFCM